MTRSKRVSWPLGAVFAVPLPDGSYAIGQAAALMMPNVVYCAFTERRFTNLSHDVPALNAADVISAIAVTREQLDYGVWPVLGTAPLVVDKAEFRNEQFAAKGYVGAKMYDAALAEDLLAAFHRLAPWDDWKEPDYLDGLLVSPDRRPANPVLVGKRGAPN